MDSFNGKTVLITGASSGIGEAFAKKLASEKANLIITARSKEKLYSLAEDLESAHSIRVHVYPMDLSEPGGARNLYEKIKESGLSIDVLINNAGFGKSSKFLDTGAEFYKSMITLNVNSLVELCYLCLPEMLQKNEGGVINVASTAAFLPLPFSTVYSATKWFVMSFSEGLYGEYRNTGVTVMALCPGATATNFFSLAHPNDDLSKAKFDTSEYVAEQGIEGFLKGENYVVVGLRKYLMAQVPRFLPRKTIIQMALNYTEKIWGRR
ncbi:MAG: SDR family oxidoreductase [Nitrospina sp.]|nr:SDR family oxidoreductase [Nitrospina sp.]